MRIPMIRLNIWIDVVEQSYNTENDTFLVGMRLNEFNIHVEVSLNIEKKMHEL